MQQARPGMIFFQGAFRPFFLGAGLWAGIALLVWLLVLGGRIGLPSRFAPIEWHVHEMLFGFVMAAIGGFLLTAIPNWTNSPPLSGPPLAALALSWLLGRAACLTSALWLAWVAPVLDLLFPVALLLVAGRALLLANNRRNFPLLLPLGLLGAANLLMHLQSEGVAVPPGIGWRLGLGSVMVLIAVIGGRIVPAFTRNWLRPRGGPVVPEAGPLDMPALILLPAALVLWVALPDLPLAGVALLAAAGLHLVRLSRWRALATRQEPLLLILHVGYLWMAVGVGLLGLSVLTPRLPVALAIHAMTAGAVGTMTLAVMTRATLGHTGRGLTADRMTRVVFALVSIAAVLRLASALPIAFGPDLLAVSGAAWIAAFGLFSWRYGRMCLTAPA